MNKSKIEWCDYTWNPVSGCLHGCEYCYAHRIAQRFGNRYMPYGDGVNVLNEPFDGERGIDPYPYGFEPTFHKYRLDEPQQVKKPSKIFVVSMGDLFGDWVPDEWIEEVFKTCEKAPQHTYMFLTKNPYRYLQLHIREKLPKASNCWYGTTLTGQGRLPFNCLDFKQNFVSIEPLLGDVSDKLPFTNIQWVIVGAQTGPGAVPPKPEWVQSIIDQCRCAKVPIFLKDNLNWPDKIQEWP
jgi:protein gp37